MKLPWILTLLGLTQGAHANANGASTQENIIYGVITSFMILIILVMAVIVVIMFRYNLDICTLLSLLRTNFKDIILCRYKKPAIPRNTRTQPLDYTGDKTYDRSKYDDNNTFGELPPPRPHDTPESTALGGGILTESMLDLEQICCSSSEDESDTDHSEPPAPTERVPVTEYVQNYGSKNIDQEKVKQQFEALATWSKAITSKRNHAKMEKNRPKNRYFDIVPFNYNRVPLYDASNPQNTSNFKQASSREQKQFGYINASYIHEYGSQHHKYIAAQGPLARTLRDFWQMVWQEKSDVVVMLTSLREQGKVKCEQYWPKEKGQNLDFSDVKVILEVYQCYAYYDYRIIILQKGVETRKVHHYLYHHWPDKEAPDMVVPVLDLYHKVFRRDHQTSAPVIVHCSAGVGRTGTFIALDYLLHEAEELGSVDVQRCVYELRRQRVSMVQKVSQYQFVYEALHEALEAKQTMVKAASFNEWFSDAQKSPDGTYIKHFQMIRDKCPDEPTDAEGKLKENENKNRDPTIIPEDMKRPFLITYMKGRTNYINAVYINGFLETNAMIVTQVPLEHTVEDFWRLVYDRSCTILLLLEPPDSDFPCFWPKDNEKKTYGKTITVSGSEDKAQSTSKISVRNYKVILTQQQDYAVNLKVLQLKTWPGDVGLPPNKLDLVDLMTLWRKTQSQASIVQCMDGAAKCGLFCACCYISEQILTDHEVDIYHACRMVTSSRPEFISSLEQYTFLHEFALELLHTFDDYSNFSEVIIRTRPPSPAPNHNSAKGKKARPKPPSIRLSKRLSGHERGPLTDGDASDLSEIVVDGPTSPTVRPARDELYINSSAIPARHSMSVLRGPALDQRGNRTSLPVSVAQPRPSKPPRVSLEARALLDPIARHSALDKPSPDKTDQAAGPVSGQAIPDPSTTQARIDKRKSETKL